jgi:hypothetical protein
VPLWARREVVRGSTRRAAISTFDGEPQGPGAVKATSSLDDELRRSSAAESLEAAIRARADVLMALVLVALGIIIFYFSWTMPRLENRQVHPATIPGLVPILLSAALTLCALLLLWRSTRIAAPGGWSGLGALLRTRAALRVGVILALAFLHTLVLVGWLPFWAAAMAFIFAFIVVFETWLAEEPPNFLSTIAWALGIAVVGGGGIFFVFERIFLVRLP